MDQITLPIVESFYTLQGEGAFQGFAAYFIRLGGCDVGCPWCDTKHSWPIENHPLVPIDILVKSVVESRCRLAVITGGEPTLHPLAPLTASLANKHIRTHLETAGVYPITGLWDWVCLSPKKIKSPIPEAYEKADELKAVIYHPSDFAWAESEAAKVGPNCRLFLQPEWSRRETILPMIVAYIQKNPRWQLSLQTHKYIQIP